MKKFKCTVTRTDEYEIEIDESIINEEWMEHFRTYMYNFNELSEHAEHLAQFQARLGSEYDFIEGYGYVKRDGKLPYSHEDFDKNGNWLPEAERRQPAPGININIISEDDECEVDVEELDNN